MKRINRTVITILLFLVVAINVSCVNNTNTYRGSLVEVDFSGDVVLEDQDWIKIDGIKFTHYKDFGKSLADEYSLAATRTVVEEEGRELLSVNNEISIAINLGNYLDMINSREENIGGVRVQRRDLLLALGKLRLQKPDSSSFVVETSENYSPTVRVLE